ncbi:MAG: hypothetical protein WBQ36_15020 [Desulfobaccales bacterium]
MAISRYYDDFLKMLTPFSYNDILKISFIIVIVAISRVFFLGAGYGYNQDGWAVACTAIRIATKGEYVASRLPGYPVQEYLYSLVWDKGPFVFNGISACFGILATVFFALSLKKLGCRKYILPSLAFAFTPVAFLSSVNSMDSMWGMAFILGGLYYVLNQRPWIAGLLLGLAIGCRITSGAMLIPLSILLYHKDTKNGISNILILSLSACAVGFIAFIPVFNKYGLGFFNFVELRSPSLSMAAFDASVDFWGVIGSIGLAIALLLIFIRGKNAQHESLISLTKIELISFGIAIILYLIAYIRLPAKPEYLLPILPFLILFFANFMRRQDFTILCITIILSSFFIDITGVPNNRFKERLTKYVELTQSGNKEVLLTLSGPLFIDKDKRVADLWLINQIIRKGNNIPDNSIIVSGYWHPKIQASKGVKNYDKYIRLLTRENLKYYQDRNTRIYYLPGMEEHMMYINGIDLIKIGATPLLPKEIG